MRKTILILSLGFLGALALTYGSATVARAEAAHRTRVTVSAAAGIATIDKTFTHEAGGIQFDLPDGWKSEEDGDLLTVSAPDHSIAIVFWVMEAKDFEVAAAALDEELGKQVKNVKFDGDVKEDKHNGMPHASVSGSGQIEGHDVVFSADLLMAKKPVIVLTFAKPGDLEKHADSYAKLVKSIKKLD